MTRDKIFAALQAIIGELVEIDPGKVKLDDKLNEDLDVDSIDAVDMMVKLHDLTGKKIDPETFKSIITVSDVVDAVEGLLANPGN